MNVEPPLRIFAEEDVEDRPAQRVVEIELRGQLLPSLVRLPRREHPLHERALDFDEVVATPPAEAGPEELVGVRERLPISAANC